MPPLAIATFNINDINTHLANTSRCRTLKDYPTMRQRRSHLVINQPLLRFRQEVVEIGETICVAGAGIREGDPDAEPGEGYRTAPPTRLWFTSSPKLRLLITDAPSKS